VHLLRRARAPLALVAVGVLGLAGGLQAASPSGSKCPPRNPHCQATTSTSTSTTTTTTPTPTPGLPAQWRFAYSDRTDQGLMPQYGYNLIDVTSKAGRGRSEGGGILLLERAGSVRLSDGAAAAQGPQRADQIARTEHVHRHRYRWELARPLRPLRHDVVGRRRHRELQPLRVLRGAVDPRTTSAYRRRVAAAAPRRQPQRPQRRRRPRPRRQRRRRPRRRRQRRRRHLRRQTQ